MRRAIALLSFLALGACAFLPGTAQPLGTESVTAAYSAGGGEFDDGATVIFLTRAFERNGRVAYCGVRTTSFSTGRTFFHQQEVAWAASLMLAGDRIAHGLGDLPETPWAENLTGRTASCFLTGIPWQPAYAGATPQIRIPRLQWGDFDDGGSGETVIFRQAPVHRPLPPMPEG